MENRRSQYRVAKNFFVDYSALCWTVCHSFFCQGKDFLDELDNSIKKIEN